MIRHLNCFNSGATITASEDFKMSDRDNSNSLMWFLAGLGFGALLGVLYAPRSGRETRTALRNSAQEGKEFIRNRGKEAREAVGQWVERGKDVVNRQKDQFSSAFEAGKQAYHEATGEGQKGTS
jgi:gas vesicle protein